MVPEEVPDCIGECVSDERDESEREEWEEDRCDAMSADEVSEERDEDNSGEGNAAGEGEGRALRNAGERVRECNEEEEPVRGRRDYTRTQHTRQCMLRTGIPHAHEAHLIDAYTYLCVYVCLPYCFYCMVMLLCVLVLQTWRS